MYQAEDCKK